MLLCRNCAYGSDGSIWSRLSTVSSVAVRCPMTIFARVASVDS